MDYDSIVSSVLDNYAPTITRRRPAKVTCPWINEDIRTLRRERRACERRWRKSKLHVHREVYEQKRDLVDLLILNAKRNFYEQKFSSADQKSTFELLGTLLNDDQPSLPSDSFSSDRSACESFSDYFLDKIEKIISNINVCNTFTDMKENSATKCIHCLDELPPVTADELRSIISSSPTKSCTLDTIPTWLLKKTLDVHLQVLTMVVNKSLSSGVMLSSAKRAIVIPLLKKPTLDSSVQSNYRPISNLSFLGKVIERVVLKRLVAHIQENNLDETFQSAYKAQHSTETAMIRIHNDLSHLLDRNMAVLLVLLDLSAAFDTVDHGKLLDTLKTSIGITGRAYNWFVSYLSGRSQSVCVNGELSSTRLIRFGVPQGSVLGPVLFSLYTRPLKEIIQLYGISYHRYADDIQLFTGYDPANQLSCKSAVEKMQNCIKHISHWMSSNLLKLNNDKTELLNLMSPHHLHRYGTLSLLIDGHHIKPSQCVKVLGVYLDQHLSMSQQISSVVKSCNFHLRNIGKVRKYLTTDACRTAVQSLVVSRMDYCCSLLSGAPLNQIQRLQRVQNNAARIITRVGRSDHISSVLAALHWLPCDFRIKFRILIYVFKCLHQLAPCYLRELVHIYQPLRPLRSSSDTSTLSTRPSHKRVGNQAFSLFAPVLWNKLPADIRHLSSLSSFKSALKTFYFKQIYM